MDPKATEQAWNGILQVENSYEDRSPIGIGHSGEVLLELRPLQCRYVCHRLEYKTEGSPPKVRRRIPFEVGRR